MSRGNRLFALAFAGFAMPLFSSQTYAHGGGRDSNSGHVNRSTGVYHCHTEECVNLVPSVGQPNALRGNKRYGIIPNEERLLGSCDFEWSTTLVESEDDDRGKVARIWLYFATRHALQLQDGELAMYLQWSNAHPPQMPEFIRNDRIRTQQGNGNPFVEMFPRPPAP